jgi:hypothetical protein
MKRKGFLGTLLGALAAVGLPLPVLAKKAPTTLVIPATLQQVARGVLASAPKPYWGVHQPAAWYIITRKDGEPCRVVSGTRPLVRDWGNFSRIGGIAGSEGEA